MKKLTAAVLLVTMIAVSSSCKKDIVGEGPVTTETRILSNFSGIDLQMNGQVYYKNDPNWKVEISAKQSIHSILETSIVNNRLVIKYYNGKTYDSDESIRINVSGPGLNSFVLHSSGSIYATNALQVDQLHVHSNGSGNISLQQVLANSIDAESKTSGRISATGGVTNLEKIKTDGSGIVDLSAIDSKYVTARVIGSGDIKVKVSEKLEARIDGSGSIFFRGTPLLSTDINGTGKIIRF